MPLRIGYYVTCQTAGGMERHVLALVDRLLPERHELTVICDRAESVDPLCRQLEKKKVAVKRIAMDRRRAPLRGLVDPAALLAARAGFVSARFDVIHFHAGRLGLVYPAILASRLARVPRRILTLHNPVEAHSPLRRFFEGRALRSLDRIVAISDFVKNELADKKAAAKEKIIVIPNGVDAAEFEISPESRSRARAALGLPEESSIVGMVGRLDDAKGADLLIRAAALIRAREPRLRVVLIGAGPAEQKLKQLAHELELSTVVSFAGHRSDARALMPAFDLLVLPSRYEAQSYSLLEAMACGKAVVAANVGGIPGVVVDGVTGLLFPPEDVAALAEAIVELLGAPEKSETMGRAGRRRVESQFSQSAMLEKTMALYAGAGA